MVKYCKQCKIPFSVKLSVAKAGGGKYCSVKCKAEYTTTKVELTCQFCQELFELKEYQYKRGEGKYCSIKCYRDDHKKIKVNCNVCNKEFGVIPAFYNAGRGKYCSQECYHIGKSKERTKGIVCEICGKTFRRNVARINLSKRHFCSPECQSIGHTGENNPMWNGGIENDSIDRRVLIEYKEWRARVYKEYNYKCHLCNSEDNIAAHHLYGFKDYPEFKYDSDNGIVLCESCHVGYHSFAKRNNFKVNPDSFTNYQYENYYA